MNASGTMPQDTKRIFAQCGACSHTFFLILNRAFGDPRPAEERASNPLAGGLMNGHQCGMLWGSALAVGAEAFRRYSEQGQAIAAAITATQCLMDSFAERARSVNCRDVVGCDLSNRLGMVVLMLKILLHGGMNNSVCFNLAEKWAPEAIQSASEGLSRAQAAQPQSPLSCASEVARKMGASAEETVIVAGLAGGMGLSGNACGALGAAIWLNALAQARNDSDGARASLKNPGATKLLKAFTGATGSGFRCHKIAGRRFETLADHTEFLKNGGCHELIELLATEGM